MNNTHRTTRPRNLANKLSAALISTVAVATISAGTAMANPIDDKDGPIQCIEMSPDLVSWNYNLVDATTVNVSVQYADDWDTCAQDLSIFTVSLPSAEASYGDEGAMPIDIWEPSINDIESNGGLAVDQQLLGCFNEIRIYAGDALLDVTTFVDLCPQDQPQQDQPQQDQSGAGQPGGPSLPETGTGSTVMATIAGLLVAAGVALARGARRPAVNA